MGSGNAAFTIGKHQGHTVGGQYAQHQIVGGDHAIGLSLRLRWAVHAQDAAAMDLPDLGESLGGKARDLRDAAKVAVDIRGVVAPAATEV